MMKFFLYDIEYTLKGTPRFRFTNEITVEEMENCYLSDWALIDDYAGNVMDHLSNTPQVLPPVRLPDNIIGYTIVSAATQEAAGELVRKYIDAQVSLLEVCPNTPRFITLPY